MHLASTKHTVQSDSHSIAPAEQQKKSPGNRGVSDQHTGRSSHIDIHGPTVHGALGVKRHRTVLKRKQGVIATHTDVDAGVKSSSALPNND